MALNRKAHMTTIRASIAAALRTIGLTWLAGKIAPSPDIAGGKGDRA